MRRSNDGSGAAPDADGPDAVTGAVDGSDTGGSGGPDMAPDAAAGPASDSAAADTPDAADAADVQALLISLSHLRLSLSADLSAAAGALDAERPEIAAEIVEGARSEMAQLHHAAWRRELQKSVTQQLVSAGVGDRSAGSAGPADLPPTEPTTDRPHIRVPRPLRRPGRILASALALALAIIVVPHLSGGGGGHPAPHPAAIATTEPAMRLASVSAEFTALRTTLQNPKSTPAAVVAAGRKWQQALSRNLTAASTHRATAAQIVTLLRLERTVIFTSPSLRKPQFTAATAMLTDSSDSVLGELRVLATAPVLAALPTAITALPILPSGSNPEPQPTPATGPGSDPGTGSSTGPANGGSDTSPGTGQAPQPDPTPTTPGQGTGTTPPSPAVPPVPVTPAPVLPLPQLPQLPLIGNLTNPLLPTTDTTTTTSSSSTSTTTSSTAGGTDQGNALSETVTSVLNGLGLGG